MNFFVFLQQQAPLIFACLIMFLLGFILIKAAIVNSSRNPFVTTLVLWTLGILLFSFAGFILIFSYVFNHLPAYLV